MDFRVLGPLEVSDGHDALPLGGFRQRLVLGVLLLQPNRVATTDWLIDAVWGDDPPATARKTLQIYISRLRSVVGYNAIEATGSGYSLRIRPDDLDSVRFEGLADEGHRLLTNDPPHAAKALHEALSLWRGMPWGDLGDEQAVLAESQRLRERRLVALEDRIAADLATGHAAALVGEIEGLVDEHPWRERFREHLMLALYRAGRQADALRAFQSARKFLGEELGIEPSPELMDLEQRILLQDPELAGSPPAVESADWRSARNPYKGLRPFRQEDHADFFGRSDLIDELVGRVEDQRFVAVIGASGSGKSSVVMAGLIPRLSRDEWTTATMVPGSDPFRALEAALLPLQPDGRPRPPQRGDSLDLLRVLQSALPDNGPRLLLVIDQFEELLDQATDEDVRTRFLRNLAEAIEDPSTRFTVLITLRADFFDKGLGQTSFGELIGAHHVNVLPLRAHELEAAAVCPGEQVGLHLDPELIADLVGDMTDQPGALPLFQYVLTQLFDERSGPHLTRSAYRRLGGLDGALSRRAEETFRALSPDAQAIARQVFRRLVTVGPEGGDGRRRVDRASLESLDPEGVVMEEVLGGFDAARLLTFDRNPINEEATVEVAHEALLREWPRMRGWLDAAREDLRLHGALVTQVEEWEASTRDVDYLLAGSRLDLYADWQERTDIDLTEPERAYLAAGISHRDDTTAAEEARANEELRLERRSGRRLRALVAVVSVAALVAAGLTLFAASRNRQAVVSEREARARELANASLVNLDSDPELALLLALEAIDATRSVQGSVVREAMISLHQAVAGTRLLATHSGAWSVEFMPNGTMFVGGDRPKLLDPLSGAVLLELPEPTDGKDVEAVAVSPDGNQLATGTSSVSTGSAELALWDAASGSEIKELTTLHGAAHSDTVATVEYSPDGRLLASIAPWGGGLRVWNVASGDLVAQGVDYAAWADCCPPVRLDFSPDSAFVAVTTMIGDVKILDVASSKWTTTLSGHESAVTGVQYLPDGVTILTASYDGTIRWWDTSGTELAAIDAGVGQINALAVSQDGALMLAGGDTGLVRLWQLRPHGAEPMATLAGHRSAVLDVAFHPDSKLAASVALDGEVRVWDGTSAGRGEIATWPGDGPVAFSPDGTLLAAADEQGRDFVVRDLNGENPDMVLRVAPYLGGDPEWGLAAGIAFSPDGRYVATTSFGYEEVTGAVTLWDVASGTRLRTLTQHPYLRGSVAFSGDGARVAAAACAVGGQRSTASVWTVPDGDLIFTTPPGPCGHAVDLSPDGRLLAVSNEESVDNVQVWNIADEELVASMTVATPWQGAVRFSPDGNRLLTTDAGGKARIWDVASGDLLVEMPGHTGFVEEGMWTSDGTEIATASLDGTVRLWDAGSGENLLVLQLDAGYPHIAISSDGQHLATSSGGVVRVWTLDLDELLAIGNSRLTRSLSAAECVTYHFDHCPGQP